LFRGVGANSRKREEAKADVVGPWDSACERMEITRLRNSARVKGKSVHFLCGAKTEYRKQRKTRYAGGKRGGGQED